jgi:hypothetical protein
MVLPILNNPSPPSNDHRSNIDGLRRSLITSNSAANDSNFQRTRGNIISFPPRRQPTSNLPNVIRTQPSSGSQGNMSLERVRSERDRIEAKARLNPLITMVTSINSTLSGIHGTLMQMDRNLLKIGNDIVSALRQLNLRVW